MEHSPQGLKTHRHHFSRSISISFRTGFTLIELLVVIAIIAILAGLLLPVLSRAKQRAQMVTDLNNTRQIIMSTHMYTGDFDDGLPRPGWKISFPCWAYGFPFPYSDDPSSSGYSANYQGQLDAVARGQLFPYMKDARLLMCPGDKLNSLFYQREMYVSSYIWNGAISSYDTSSAKTFKLAQFKPSNILFWESDETDPITFNDGGNLPYEGFTRRHGGNPDDDATENISATATIGCFDGSTRRMKTFELYKLSGGLGTYPNGPTPGSTELPNDLWCNPGNTNGTL